MGRGPGLFFALAPLKAAVTSPEGPTRRPQHVGSTREVGFALISLVGG